MPKYNHRPALRAVVREVLALIPKGRRVTPAFIRREVNLLGAYEATENEIDSVIAYLDDEAQVQSRLNGDMERTEWELTERGRQLATAG